MNDHHLFFIVQSDHEEENETKPEDEQEEEQQPIVDHQPVASKEVSQGLCDFFERKF